MYSTLDTCVGLKKKLHSGPPAQTSQMNQMSRSVRTRAGQITPLS